jgi:hypothetical protein
MRDKIKNASTLGHELCWSFKDLAMAQIPFTRLFLYFALIGVSYLTFFSRYLHSEHIPLELSPRIGRFCQDLLKKRLATISLKQKAQAMLRRVESVSKETPPNKRSVREKLSYIYTSVNQKLRLLEYQINNLEEKIVRNGCPGVSL